MWKRISAAILDLILLLIAVTGCAFLLSTVLDYDSYGDRMQACYDQYEKDYGIKFDISQEEYDKLAKEERDAYDAALEAISKDDEVNYLYSMMFNLTLIIISISVLLAYLLLEFLVPLLFKNGQTVGKKVFGVGVMRIDGVRLSPMLLFVRAVLGKYTIGLMIPILLLVAVYFNFFGIVGIVGAALMLLAQLTMLLVTRDHTVIHDKLACTVTVDLASQMIFDTPEAMLEYRKNLHAQEAKTKD
ncbi:MAG: RDD family protein [Clostridia bacterium]|nr:RDD family protein [Clostridia bacterium]